MMKKMVFLVLLMPLTVVWAKGGLCRFESRVGAETLIACMKGLYEQLQMQQAKIQWLEEKIQASQKPIQAQQPKIQGLEEKNQASQQRIQAQQAKIQGLEEKNQASQQRIQAQQAKIQGLEEKNQASQQRIQTQQAKIQSLEEKIQALRRYVDNGDGTVRDNKTGMIWMKKANCAGEKNWIEAKQWAANLRQGQCGLRDGSQKGDWRLPTKEEWEAMLDKKYKKPALSNADGTGQWTEGDAFTGVKSYWYWSSTSYSSSSAWYANIYGGDLGNYGNTFTNYVWAVRLGN